MSQQSKSTEGRPNTVLSVFCGISALLSITMNFAPLGVISQRSTTGMIQFAIDGIHNEFLSIGDFESILLFVSLTASMILLLIWAIRSFKRSSKSWSIGLIASVYYAVQSWFVLSMMGRYWESAYRVPVLMLFFLTVANIVLVLLQYKSKKKNEVKK